MLPGTQPCIQAFHSRPLALSLQAPMHLFSRALHVFLVLLSHLYWGKHLGGLQGKPRRPGQHAMSWGTLQQLGGERKAFSDAVAVCVLVSTQHCTDCCPLCFMTSQHHCLEAFSFLCIPVCFGLGFLPLCQQFPAFEDLCYNKLVQIWCHRFLFLLQPANTAASVGDLFAVTQMSGLCIFCCILQA